MGVKRYPWSISQSISNPVLTDCIARQALLWNPQGSRWRGRPRNRWRRDTDCTIHSKGYTWTEIEHVARDSGGLEAIRQWPILQNGVKWLQMRSDQISNPVNIKLQDSFRFLPS